MNICLVLREFLRIDPHTILLEVAQLFSHVGDFLLQVNRITSLNFQHIRIIRNLLLILHLYKSLLHRRNVQEVTFPHSDSIKYLQLGYPFEPRFWNLQLTRLDFLCINLSIQGLKFHSFQ